MRSLLTGSAGLALIFLTMSPANSITITAPAAARQASDALELTEAVHCRKYLHQHKLDHAWGRGCDVEIDVDGPRRSGVVSRGGGTYNPAPLGVAPLAPIGRPAGNYINPNNPQDRSGNLNPRDMTQPRVINPQDMR